MTNRIFLPQSVLKSENGEITGEWHKQVSVVLRGRPGDQFTAICGDGFEYMLELGSITSRKTNFRITGKTGVNREPSVRITLFAGQLKASGLEELLPGMVVLGVGSVIPVITQRSQGKAGEFSGVRRERIDRIIQRASALSGRTQLMSCSEPVLFPEALKMLSDYSYSFFFWEENFSVPLKSSFSGIGRGDSVALFTGPEGGYTSDEASAASGAGCEFVSLGSRILDARTAPVAAVSALLYETENI